MKQAIALAAVQDAIAAQYPCLSIELIAQVHHIRPNDIAHVDVYGCDDTTQRRAIREQAVSLLRQLGIRVELIGGHDIYTVSPDRAALQDYADRLHLLACSEAPASVLPPFRIPSDAEVEAELAEAMPLLRRMQAAIQGSDDDD